MIKIGTMIGDRYEVLERIGMGGMSDVYKAKDHKLNRHVAVKVLKQEFSENTNFVSKFRVEAQAAASLMHPNIVNVYDVGEDNGVYYIVMELVDGITLKKYIPVAAGMGGGSSDAAAALVGLNRLWGLGLSPDKLEEIGLTVGADVPFCIRGGLQRAKGVGEKLTPLAMKKPLYLVAFQPCRGLSTKEVFTALHEDSIRDEDRPDNEAAQRALACGDVRALGSALGNVLEPVSRRMRPEIDRAICAIEENGAVGARMTGSGSAVFGVFMHAGACRRATERLVTAYPACRMMRTAAHGILIEEEAQKRYNFTANGRPLLYQPLETEE